MMIESVKGILEKYGIKEEQFVEAVKALCFSFDSTYKDYPEDEYQGMALMEHLLEKDLSSQICAKKKFRDDGKELKGHYCTFVSAQDMDAEIVRI